MLPLLSAAEHRRPLCAFHNFILYIVLFLYAAFLCFLLCMYLLYITVLLPVGVIKDDDWLVPVSRLGLSWPGVTC